MSSHINSFNDKITFDWLVIGGGLGGICGMARLLELYENQHECLSHTQLSIQVVSILWVDADNFQAGDLRKRYGTVSSNTPVKNFTHFFNRLEAMKVYPFSTRLNYFKLNNTNQDEPCSLKIFTDQLLDVTQYWLTTYPFILVMEGVVKKIRLISNTFTSYTYSFQISTKHTQLKQFQAKNIILAHGCDPKIPPRIGCLRTNTFIDKINIIPLFEALDPIRLSKWQKILKPKNVLVFGNAHSGVLILRNLENLGWSTENTTVYNIIKHPIVYPIEIKVNTKCGTETVELYDQTGIRGIALKWAQENLQPVNKTNIKILNLNDHLNKIEQLLSLSNTCVIFAIGFKPRYIDININTESDMATSTQNIKPCYHNEENKFVFDVENGTLAPNVYGLGLAFPETEYHHNIYECNVGLNEFLNYARKSIQKL